MPAIVGLSFVTLRVMVCFSASSMRGMPLPTPFPAPTLHLVLHLRFPFQSTPSSPSPHYPSGICASECQIQSLLMELCDETKIAELQVKVSGAVLLFYTRTQAGTPGKFILPREGETGCLKLWRRRLICQAPHEGWHWLAQDGGGASVHLLRGCEPFPRMFSSGHKRSFSLPSGRQVQRALAACPSGVRKDQASVHTHLL